MFDLRTASLFSVLEDPFHQWVDPRDKAFVSGIGLSVFCSAVAAPWDAGGVSFSVCKSHFLSGDLRSWPLEDLLDLIHDTPELTLASIGLLG